MNPKRPFESIGFAAVAALCLAPLLFQLGWLLLGTLLNVEADALGLNLGAILTTAGVVAAHALFPGRRHLVGISVGTGIGIILGLVLGQNLGAQLALCVTYLAFSAIQSLFVASLAARVPDDLHGLASKHKVRTVLLALLSAFSIMQTAKLSTFMVDHKRVEYSVLPDLEFFKSHSCLTAYVQAVELAQSGVEDLYAARHWPDETILSQHREKSPDSTGPYKPFYLDDYMYPPQFLLLPAAVHAISQDFFVERGLWFALSALFLALGFWLTARWVGEPGKHHALLLIPLLWSSLGVLLTMQAGNVHHVVMVMAVLAMIAFEQKRPAVGGALLAFSILAKISPGILVVTLLAQRRWRDIAWTAGFGLIYTLATVLLFGIHPIESFLTDQFPDILSGESVKWFSLTESSVLINSSPFGTPFKLQLLGMEFDDIWGSGRKFNLAFTAIIVIVAVWAALKKRDRTQQLSMWLGLLTLSAMQSPFAPGYVIMPIVWLLTVLAADVKSLRHLILYAFALAMVAFPLPILGTAGVINSLFQQAVVMGVIVYGFVRKGKAGAVALEVG